MLRKKNLEKDINTEEEKTNSENNDNKMSKDSDNKMTFKEIVFYFIIIIAVVLIKNYVVTPVRVSGDSMINTLHNKDILLLDKITYRFQDIKRFDIVVLDNEDEYIIKRVIGLPGEKIVYKNNKLYVNGQQVKENYSHKETEDFEVTVPKDAYFVLGDNRVNSVDSRILGSFSKSKVLGKANLIIFPFNRVGHKK